jgi:hypothetical protein
LLDAKGEVVGGWSATLTLGLPPACPSFGNNPLQCTSMKKAFIVAGLVLSLLFAAGRATAQSAESEPAIALVGGTLIDVSNRGDNSHDISKRRLFGHIYFAGANRRLWGPEQSGTGERLALYGSDHDRRASGRTSWHVKTRCPSQSAHLPFRWCGIHRPVQFPFQSSTMAQQGKRR